VGPEANEPDRVNWFPGRARAAVSITFDDARPSQLDHGIPALDRHGVRATFYVLPAAVGKRPDDWRRVAATGHEIGNHTKTHPCSANHNSSRDNPLESLTIESVERDIDVADDEIHTLLGVRPCTFAYPCGQTAVGRGEHKASYVPVVARRFVAGRGYRSETANDPSACDLALVDAFHADGMAADGLLEIVDRAVEQERWAVFVCHEVGEAGPLGIAVEALDALCRALATDRRVWVATVADVALRIRAKTARRVPLP
jgi:peptidoglycan/xylan/chitin deacetylase (PgdA/CDA1 family)